MFSPAPTMVNVGFLQSGGEFQAPSRAMGDAAAESVIIKLTRQQRLERFHEATLRAFAAKPTSVSASRAAPLSPAPTMVNVSFLQSGGEFAAQQQQQQRPQQPGDQPGRASRQQRLERFHAKTLRAAAAATTAANGPGAGAGAQARAHRHLSPDRRRRHSSSERRSVVNLGFLRSGGEFVQPAGPATKPAAAEPSPPRLGRHARLERFHARMLEACARQSSARESAARAAEPTPTVVNLGFLRSGGEFQWHTHRVGTRLGQPVAADSPEPPRRAAAATTKSRHERLEAFHARTLAGYAESATARRELFSAPAKC